MLKLDVGLVRAIFQTKTAINYPQLGLEFSTLVERNVFSLILAQK